MTSEERYELLTAFLTERMPGEYKVFPTGTPGMFEAKAVQYTKDILNRVIGEVVLKTVTFQFNDETEQYEEVVPRITPR